MKQRTNQTPDPRLTNLALDDEGTYDYFAEELPDDTDRVIDNREYGYACDECGRVPNRIRVRTHYVRTYDGYDEYDYHTCHACDKRAKEQQEKNERDRQARKAQILDNARAMCAERGLSEEQTAKVLACLSRVYG